MFLEIRGIRKSFGEGDSLVEVLKGIDLSVEKGEFCVLLGPSGSGKSTLFNIIGGIDRADEGSITIAYEASLVVFLSRDHLNDVFDLGKDMYGGYFSSSEITDIDDKYIGSVIDLETLTKMTRQMKISMGGMMWLESSAMGLWLHWS